MRRYGITIEQYDEMLRLQGGGCAICGAAQQASGQHLSVDHDHATGKVRGILCKGCNTRLHSVEDGGFLARATEYLSVNREETTT